MTELKPCPFCGGAAAAETISMYGTPLAHVQCSQCRASSGTVAAGEKMDFYTREIRHVTPDQAEAEAIRKWNTRTENEPRTNNENVKGR